MNGDSGPAVRHKLNTTPLLFSNNAVFMPGPITTRAQLMASYWVFW